MAVVDVMACGRPVVAFDVGAFREMGIAPPYLVKTADELARAIALTTSRTTAPDDWLHLAAQRSGQRAAELFETVMETR
jgi:glycosyltransferase involved in cell wall biosynthesis